MKRPSASAVVLATVVVASVLLPLAAGLAAANGVQDGPGADATDAEQLDYYELTAKGDLPENAPPGVRAADTYEEFRMKTLPGWPFVDDDPESGWWQPYRAGTTIKRDRIQIWSKRGYGLPEKNVTIRWAVWQKKMVTVERGNTTVREPRARNITTQAIDATIGGGYDYVTVDLPPHYDATWRVTVCVQEPGATSCLEDDDVGVRWTGKHHSRQWSAPISTSTSGGRVLWGYGIIFLPFLASTIFSMKATQKGLEKAYAPPKLNIWWLLGLFFLAVFGILLGWNILLKLAIRAPWAFPILGGMVLGILAALWFGSQTFGSLFLRLRLDDWHDSLNGADPRELEREDDDRTDIVGSDEDESDDAGRLQRMKERGTRLLEGAPVKDHDAEAEDARPGDAPGVLRADVIPMAFARGKNGERFWIREGFWNWIARARGATAELLADEGSVHARVDVDQGPFEELYFLDPSADEPLQAKPESHDWGFPQLTWVDDDGQRHYNLRAPIGGAFALLLSYAFGVSLLGNAFLGLLIGGGVLALWKLARPKKGYLKAQLAPTHYNSVVGTVLQHASAFGEAMNSEDLYEELVEKNIEVEMLEQELQDSSDLSQMRQIVDEYVGTNEADIDGAGADVAEPADEEVPADD